MRGHARKAGDVMEYVGTLQIVGRRSGVLLVRDEKGEWNGPAF
jgi:hypothetical protein